MHQALQRASSRFLTKTDWLTSYHSFSFGRHWEPANTHHGLLLVNNDDLIAPGTGFSAHAHRNMEIVTWVLSGSLVHKDSTGTQGVIYPGLAQRMSAGSGVVHSEMNDAWLDFGEFPQTTTRLVQMWVVPDEENVEPSYEQYEIGDFTGLVHVASGDPKAGAALHLYNEAATFSVANLTGTTSVLVPDAPWVHVFVATGRVLVEGFGSLSAGDALRLHGGGQRVESEADAQVLFWHMRASISPDDT